MNRFLKDPSGFTLIEVVMVIVLLGIMGASILMYFTGIRSGDMTLQAQGATLAQSELEKLMADKRGVSFASIVSLAAAPMPAPFDRFTKEVQVFCVNEADLDTSAGAMPDCNDSDIRAKKVKVIISWQNGSADFSTVISNH